MEQCLGVRRGKTGLVGMLATHVDDLRGRMEPWVADELQAKLETALKVGEFRRDEEHSDFVGLQWKREADGTLVHQQAYTEQKLEEIQLDKKRWKQKCAPITPAERSMAKRVEGQLRWICRTRTDLLYEVSLVASLTGITPERTAESGVCMRVQDLARVNKLVRFAKETAGRGLFIPNLEGEFGVVVIIPRLDGI